MLTMGVFFNCQKLSLYSRYYSAVQSHILDILALHWRAQPGQLGWGGDGQVHGVSCGHIEAA